MYCQICGENGPTKHVTFYQNIGMVIMRSSKTVEGDLCRLCIDKVFWKLTLTTLFLGWWGMISFVVTPFFLINNVARFLGSRSLKPIASLPPVPHPTASLTPDARTRLALFTGEMQQRIRGGEPVDVVCENVARKAGVSAYQAELMAKELG